MHKQHGPHGSYQKTNIHSVAQIHIHLVAHTSNSNTESEVLKEKILYSKITLTSVMVPYYTVTALVPSQK